MSVLPTNEEAEEQQPTKTRTGFVGNLTPEEEETLQNLKQRCQTEGLTFEVYKIEEPHTLDHLLLRFLRARNFNLEQSFKMLKNDVEWRNKNDIIKLLDQQPINVHKCDPQTISSVFPQLFTGFDKQGRPVLYKKMGANCLIDNLFVGTETSVENLVMYHCMCQERLSQICVENSRKLNKHIEAFVTIIDAAGWGVRLNTFKAVSYGKQLAETDGAHYPERMGVTVVLNAPSIFVVGWTLVKSWLSEETQNKVKIVRGIEEYSTVLRELMDESVIPEEYGGQYKATAESWAMWST